MMTILALEGPTAEEEERAAIYRQEQDRSRQAIHGASSGRAGGSEARQDV